MLYLDFDETRVAKIPQNEAPSSNPLEFQMQGANGAVGCFNNRFAISSGTCAPSIHLYISAVMVVVMVVLRMAMEMLGMEYWKGMFPIVVGCTYHFQTLPHSQIC